MSKPTGYWCPMCGDLPDVTNPFPWTPGKAWHHGACDFKAIPRFKPLDVPEVTTWGESGGAEAVCLQLNGITPWWMLGDNNARVADLSICGWWMSGPRVYRATDITTAINYVAGAT